MFQFKSHNRYNIGVALVLVTDFLNLTKASGSESIYSLGGWAFHATFYKIPFSKGIGLLCIFKAKFLRPV